MKRIIVPIDFSSYSENAFLTSLKLAEKTKCKVTCINVVSTLLDWKFLSKEQKAQHQDILDLEAEAKEKMREFLAGHRLHGVAVEADIEVGVPRQVILDAADSMKADLIVIGAYGKDYQDGKVLGSNLQYILRNANCPVLAVKQVMSGNDLRKVVFASLFNESSKQAFAKMKHILKNFKSSVHFLIVSTPSNFVDTPTAEATMDAYAKGNEDLVIHKHVFNYPETENGIVEFAKSRKMGFIAIASGNRKGSAYYQVGVTDTVLFKTDLAVLSVKIE
jgi:nucleotide-binding universal stress UspA family protein